MCELYRCYASNDANFICPKYISRRNASIACEKNTFGVTLASGQGNRFSESALNYTSLRNRVIRQALKRFSVKRLPTRYIKEE